MALFPKLEFAGSRRRRRGGGFWPWLLVAAALALLIWLWWRGGNPDGTGPDQMVSTDTTARRATNHTPLVSAPITNAAQPSPPLAATNLSRGGNGVVDSLPPPDPRVERPGYRTAATVLEAQIAMTAAGISCGAIDGAYGAQTRAAVRAFQLQQRLAPDGALNEATKQRMYLSGPTFGTYLVTSNDLARLAPVGATWWEKSEQESLDYESILELVAEKHLASQALIQSLNPLVNWTNVTAGLVLRTPNVARPVKRDRAAWIRIQLGAKTLEVFGAATNLLAHFPCSIARKVEKRPVGRLMVAKVARNPNYVFDPEIYPESEEAQEIGHKLVIPPGPNNPVGTAWIGLDRPGYGIHGTPRPEQVGRTESHGCFRLANWNAEFLFELVWVGLPVLVEP